MTTTATPNAPAVSTKGEGAATPASRRLRAVAAAATLVLALVLGATGTAHADSWRAPNGALVMAYNRCDATANHLIRVSIGAGPESGRSSQWIAGRLTVRNTVTGEWTSTPWSRWYAAGTFQEFTINTGFSRYDHGQGLRYDVLVEVAWARSGGRTYRTSHYQHDFVETQYYRGTYRSVYCHA